MQGTVIGTFNLFMFLSATYMVEATDSLWSYEHGNIVLLWVTGIIGGLGSRTQPNRAAILLRMHRNREGGGGGRVSACPASGLQLADCLARCQAGSGRWQARPARPCSWIWSRLVPPPPPPPTGPPPRPPPRRLG